MASNKNQHFVPRCYLKAFSLDGAGAAIHLLNIDREKCVLSAPLKHQCSRDYFYGEDLQMEKALQGIEGHYSAIAREIFSPGYLLTDDHRVFLRQFWLIQHLRTEAASIRSVQMANQLRQAAGVDDLNFRIEIKEAVLHSMSIAIEQLPAVQDMRVCLLRNRTNEPFITSDDPAVLTNRWYLVSSKTKGMSFGIGAAGALFLLPLSPHVLCVAYDGDVYSVPHENGWVDVQRTADVHALNQHQLLNCNANVYFHDSGQENTVRQQFAKAKDLRLGAKHRAHYAVYEGTQGGASEFRVAERHDAVEHERALIHIEAVHPRPPSWPAQIKARQCGAVYTNGTGLGFIRRASLLDFGAVHFTKLRPW